MLDAIALNKLNFATDQISLPSPRTTLFIQPPEDNPKTQYLRTTLFILPTEDSLDSIALEIFKKANKKSKTETKYTVKKII